MIPFTQYTEEQLTYMVAAKANPPLIARITYSLASVKGKFVVWSLFGIDRLYFIYGQEAGKDFKYLFNDCINGHIAALFYEPGLMTLNHETAILKIDYYKMQSGLYEECRQSFMLANWLTASRYPKLPDTNKHHVNSKGSYFGTATLFDLRDRLFLLYDGAAVAEVEAEVLGIKGKLTLIEPSLEKLKQVTSKIIEVSLCKYTIDISNISMSVRPLTRYVRPSLPLVTREVIMDTSGYKVGEPQPAAYFGGDEKQTDVEMPVAAKDALLKVFTLFTEETFTAIEKLNNSKHVQLTALQQNDLQHDLQKPLKIAVSRLQEIREDFNLECLDKLIQCGITELTGAREKRFFARKFQFFMLQHDIVDEDQLSKIVLSETGDTHEDGPILVNENSEEWKFGLETHFVVTRPEDAGLLLPDVDSPVSETLRNVIDKMVTNPIAQAVNEGLIPLSAIAETVAHLGYQTEAANNPLNNAALAKLKPMVILEQLQQQTPLQSDDALAGNIFQLPPAVQAEIKNISAVFNKSMLQITEDLEQTSKDEAVVHCFHGFHQLVESSLRSLDRSEQPMFCLHPLIDYARKAKTDTSRRLMGPMLELFIFNFIDNCSKDSECKLVSDDEITEAAWRELKVTETMMKYIEAKSQSK